VFKEKEKLNNPHQIIYTAVEGIPIINSGDDLAEIIYSRSMDQHLQVENGDIFVLAQKIVSKAEGRLVDLRSISPRFRAKRIANKVDKDPRLIELILRESKRVVRLRKGLIIVEHKNGFICANAGIDHSNSVGGSGCENFVLLLPEKPDFSAQLIRTRLEELFQKTLGVQIIDSHGRAWRNGTVGISIGLSGVPGLVDLRGKSDLFGYKLRITQVGAADELAAGASLLMGQADESLPCILAHGFPYPLRESSLSELLRTKDKDLFR
jgi:coenzyme F420-0:L-glutamate ligase/coenzyme F420-1:gamma-L-glutamate ligase